MRILMIAALALAACAGDAPGPGGTPNCTRAVYDVCVSEHDCTSNNCFNFAADGIQVCTQACDTATPCPDQDGQPVTCDTTGVCKPPMANACVVP